MNKKYIQKKSVKRVKHTIKSSKYFKNLIKVSIFVTLFIFIWNTIFNILWVKKEALAYFWDEPKNTMDVLYVGSSSIYDYFNTVLAYSKYGFTTGSVSSSSFPFAATKNVIDETRKYQNPKLYIIDIALLYEDFDDITINGIRRVIDTMKFGKNRSEIIDKLLYYKGLQDEKYSYYFSFLLYHNKWENYTSRLDIENYDLYKGYRFTASNLNVTKQEEKDWYKEREIPDANKKELLELIEYIKEENLNVLFVIPLKVYEDSWMARLNAASDIIKDNGFEVINFNKLYDEFNFDFSHDLYNQYHINVYGATKYTLYFSEYLSEKYNLPDHRGDSKYKSWEDEYNRFTTAYKKLSNDDFDNLIKKYLKNIKHEKLKV